MKKLIVLFFLVTFITHSCTKSNSTGNCYTTRRTVWHIDNAEASISELNGAYFIIEKNTIDTRLRPCNLPEAFKINHLAVIVSGDDKGTDQAAGPCCTDDFIITDIRKN